ncbi:MAG: FkbM family methyltransferase [Armatimonas sp.]
MSTRVKLPWSIEFFLKWRKYFDFPSVLKLRNFVLNPALLQTSDILTLTMKPPAGSLKIHGGPTDIATLGEVFEEEVYKDVLQYVKAPANIIDLGANIGLASVYFLTQSEGSRTLSIEPSSTNFALLEENTKLFAQAGRANVIQGAAWGKKCDLAISQPDAFANAFSMREATAADSRKSIIAGLRIIDIIEHSKFPTVDLLKIDIEGAETEVFNDDITWLNQVKCIAIEFHDNSRADCNFDEKMKQYGFEIKSDNKHTVVAVKR